jgi:Ni/Fe-hydrogenase subunit HybB-like protein
MRKNYYADNQILDKWAPAEKEGGFPWGVVIFFLLLIAVGIGAWMIFGRQ